MWGNSDDVITPVTSFSQERLRNRTGNRAVSTRVSTNAITRWSCWPIDPLCDPELTLRWRPVDLVLTYRPLDHESLPSYTLTVKAAVSNPRHVAFWLFHVTSVQLDYLLTTYESVHKSFIILLMCSLFVVNLSKDTVKLAGVWAIKHLSQISVSLHLRFGFGWPHIYKLYLLTYLIFKNLVLFIFVHFIRLHYSINIAG